MFEVELKNWLDKNGFGEIEVFDDDEFNGRIDHYVPTKIKT